MTTKLNDLTDIHSPDKTFAEIMKIVSLIDPDHDTAFLKKACSDIICLFQGNYPGYRASNTKYHDLEHTCSVTLATARIIHGLRIRKKRFSFRLIELGLLGALFHDTGLIQTEAELSGTGAQYTVGHEERSICLMEKYLSGHGFSGADIKDCSHIIMCTIINMPLDEIPFCSEEVKTMGKVLGSADIIAQMAARNYLEKLPLLFLEFEEARVNGFETPLELFKHTEEFYHSVARRRLTEELGDVAAAALFHFRDRWNINRDLYAESVTNNINYLKKIYEDCDENFNCLMKQMRRKV